MIEEIFVATDSMIHRIDPKIRILCAAFLSVAAALCDQLYVIPGYFAIAVILVGVARLNVVDVIKRIRTVGLFLAMIWIIVPVTFEGPVLAEYGFLKITQPGVHLCAMITVKSITILLIFTTLVATMSIASLGSGLHQLHIPDKMVFLLLMSYRYIDVIEGEYKRLLRAARFRGFRPGTNLHSYKTFAYLAGMLFVRASFRARRVYQAMVCRGFNGKFHTLDVYPPTRINLIFSLCILLAGGMLVFWEIAWMGL